MKHQTSKKINRLARKLAEEAMESDSSSEMPRRHHEHQARLLARMLNDVLLGRTAPGPICQADEPDDPLSFLPDPGSEDRLLLVSNGDLYTYAGGYWRCHTPEQIEGWASGLDGVPAWTKPGSVNAKGQVTTWQEKVSAVCLSSSDKRGIVKTLLTLEALQDPTFFDTHLRAEGGVCLQNGFLSVEKDDESMWQCKLYDHSPLDRSTYRLEIPWPEEEPEEPSEYLAHLRSCWRDDEDKEQKIDVLSEFIGLTALGYAHRISGAACILQKGVANSGKSVTHDIVESMFPRYDSAFNALVLSQNPTEWSAPSGSNSADFKLASLRHCILNSDRDIPNWGRTGDSSTFKKMITGDWVSFREPGGKGQRFIPKAGHIFSTNESILSTSENHTDGDMRRINVLEFNRSFTGDDEARNKTEYLESLTAQSEMQKLLFFSVRKAMRVLRANEQYTALDSSEKIKREMEENANHLVMFLDEACMVGDRHRQKLRFVKSEYSDWCEIKGVSRKEQLSGIEFERALKSKGFRVESCRGAERGSGKQKHVLGLDIKTSTALGCNHSWREVVAH